MAQRVEHYHPTQATAHNGQIAHEKGHNQPSPRGRTHVIPQRFTIVYHRKSHIKKKNSYAQKCQVNQSFSNIHAVNLLVAVSGKTSFGTCVSASSGVM